MKTNDFFKSILNVLEAASASIYRFFYDRNQAKLGYLLTSPIYFVERFVCFIWQLFE